MEDTRIKKQKIDGNGNSNDIINLGDNENYITKDNLTDNLQVIEKKFDH